MVHNVIRTDLIDPVTKRRIDKFDEKLEKRLDDTNFVDDVGVDLFIGNVYESDEAAHGGGSNAPIDEAYRDMMADKCPEKENIDCAAYKKYIGTEVIIEVTGEVPRSATVSRNVEDLDGTKVDNYPHNPLIDTQDCDLEYYDSTHDRYFINVIADNLYS